MQCVAPLVEWVGRSLRDCGERSQGAMQLFAQREQAACRDLPCKAGVVAFVQACRKLLGSVRISPYGKVACRGPAAALVDAYAGVYEHSAWVAEAVASGGVAGLRDDVGLLADRMAAVVEASGRDRQLELLRLHPELAGKLKVGTGLTAASEAEQAAARLNACTPEEFARFHQLNAEYRARFGFPFIIAVSGLTRREILDAFEVRILNDGEAEFRAALDQVHKIARLRIEAIARARNDHPGHDRSTGADR